jgi:spermidine synthase
MLKHSIETSDENGVRFLHFGSEWVQGAMRIARPWNLELEYTREMMLSLALRHDAAWPRTVLQVGLGAGSITKFLFKHRPLAKQNIIEINARVVMVAMQMFKLPQNCNSDGDKINIEIADGVDWMKAHAATKKRRAQFDLLIIDGYDNNARFGGLGTEDFYRDCRSNLSNSGLLALNLFGRARGYSRQLDNLHRAFDGRILSLPANDEGNAIAFAAVGETVSLETEALKSSCVHIKNETGIKWGASEIRLMRAIKNSEINAL